MSTAQYFTAILALLMQMNSISSTTVGQNMLISAENYQNQMNLYGQLVTSTAPIDDWASPETTDGTID